jgi:redox-sensing transcriptional repressor
MSAPRRARGAAAEVAADHATAGTAAQQPHAAHGEVQVKGELRTVPEATVARLATYLRVLSVLSDDSITTVSSEELAAAAGVNSAKLRKDLSFLGSYGIRGVGYDVSTLTDEISRTLGLTVNHRVALIGVGNLGQALAGYAGFASRGFRVAALLDADPSRVGSVISGLAVRPVSELEQVVAEDDITIAVLAVPGSVAQEVCSRLVEAGVTSILNFAPVVLSVPAHVDVRKVDLAAELQILSFHETRKAATALARTARANAARPRATAEVGAR